MLTHNSGNNSPFSHNYKHNLKTTHQLVQTSNFQVKIKWFSQKHVLFCQNLIFGLRWHTNTQIHRLLHCLENTSEINSKHCYKNIILGNRRHLASQWLLQYMTWIEGCRYCEIHQYNLRKVYFHYTTVKLSYSRWIALEEKSTKTNNRIYSKHTLEYTVSYCTAINSASSAKLHYSVCNTLICYTIDDS